MNEIDRIRSIMIEIAEARAQLECAEPDLPGWEAEARLQLLERELDGARVAVERARTSSGAVTERSVATESAFLATP